MSDESSSSSGKKPARQKGGKSGDKNALVNGRFRKDRQISKGVFGDVFIGTDTITNKLVAIKVEKKLHRKRSTLKREFHIYKQLHARVGFPEIYWTGEDDNCNVMVMEILGPDLKTLVPKPQPGGEGLPAKMVAKVMIYCLQGLEYLHSQDYLHQDIKPNNMTLAHGENGGFKVYLVDLGIAKRYRERGTHNHIPYTEDHKLVGTVHYASINNHLGIELSRRDDLECLGYVALFFLRPGLPWASLQKGEGKTRRAKWQKTQDMKMQFTGEKLFENAPKEFATYISYVWGLGFDEKPNYEFCRELFRDVIRRESYNTEYSEEITEEEIPRDTVQIVRNWKYRDWGLKDEGTTSSGASSYYYYTDDEE